MEAIIHEFEYDIFISCRRKITKVPNGQPIYILNLLTLMKFSNIIISILFLSSSFTYGQDKTLDRIKGSWMAEMTIPNSSPLVALMNFSIKNGIVRGTLDVPVQCVKNWMIDSAWIINDSIFMDFSTMLNSGTMFKGLMMPGDSVINGIWSQSGIQFQMRLTPTTLVYTQRSNFNPKLEGYKILNLIESTPTKDQQQAQLCWTYAATSFIETEAVRLGKNPVVLSPIYCVVPAYINKAEKYIRMHGSQGFGEGDMSYNAILAYGDLGAVPETIYTGKYDSSEILDHFKMNRMLSDKVKEFVKTGYGKMTCEGYRKAVEDILDEYIPKPPEEFIYEGKIYTPKSFAEERIGIDPADYIEITSYSHHPFYSKFILEVETNWTDNLFLNLPLSDFSRVIDNALNSNFSVVWIGDTFSGYRNGFCQFDKDTVVNQQLRQNAFDNYTTQDVHAMHIIGLAENSKGKTFYIVKNSTTEKDNGGYVYMSKDFLLLKTVSVIVHKDAIPKDIRKKVNKLM